MSTLAAPQESVPRPPGRAWGRGGLAEFTPVSWLQRRPPSPQEGCSPCPCPAPPPRRETKGTFCWGTLGTGCPCRGTLLSRGQPKGELSKDHQSVTKPLSCVGPAAEWLQVASGPCASPCRLPRSTPSPTGAPRPPWSPLPFSSRRHSHPCPHLVPQGKPLQLPDGNHDYASVSCVLDLCRRSGPAGASSEFRT